MFSQEQIELAAQVVEHYAARKLAGERRATPQALFSAVHKLTVQVAVEGLVIDDQRRYMLARRPATEKYYGANLLHVMGGFVNPGNKGMLDEGDWMARTEHHLEGLTHVAGPIAVYTWQEGEHPHGYPRSELYVFKLKGIAWERPDLAWFPYGEYPTVNYETPKS